MTRSEPPAVGFNVCTPADAEEMVHLLAVARAALSARHESKGAEP